MTSNDEIRAAATEAADQAVLKLLLTMGINASDPKALLAMQKDFAYVRAWRESIETVRRQGLVAMVGLALTGIAAAVLLALRGH